MAMLQILSHLHSVVRISGRCERRACTFNSKLSTIDLGDRVITCAIRQQFVKERKVFDLKAVNDDQKFNAANGDESKGKTKLKRSFGKSLYIRPVGLPINIRDLLLTYLLLLA